MGIGKRCHHSALLSALHIQNVSDVIRRDTLSLGKRVLAIDSPVRDLFIFLFSKAVITGESVHGTLVDRIVRYGLSPLDLFPFFQHSFKFSKQRPAGQCDGIVDPLKYVLSKYDYNKPYSDSHHLAKLLTKAF